MNPIHLIRKTMLLLLLLPPLTVISTAAEPSPGVIKGSVINQTGHGEPVKGLEIVLYQYKENQGVEVARRKTDPQGSYLFQDLNTDQRIAYYTSAAYQGADYFSEIAHFQGKNPLSLDLIVYETTDQDNDVHVKMHHILMKPGKNRFEMSEIMIVENRGNRTYVGSREVQPGKKETLRFSLPEGAGNIQSMFPMVADAGGDFSDTTPIRPGTKRIVFSYTIKPGDSTYEFAKHLYLATDSINFIFPDKGIHAESDQLTYKGPTQGAEQRFYYLSGENFKKGSRIVIHLSHPSAHTLFQWVIAGLVVVLVGAGFILSVLKGRRNRAGKGDQSPIETGRANLIAQKQKLLQSMAELDEQHHLGQIVSNEYEEKRRALKEKAVEITRILKKKTQTTQ